MINYFVYNGSLYIYIYIYNVCMHSYFNFHLLESFFNLLTITHSFNIGIIVHYTNLHFYNSWMKTFCNMILMYRFHGNAMSDFKMGFKGWIWRLSFQVIYDF